MERHNVMRNALWDCYDIFGFQTERPLTHGYCQLASNILTKKNPSSPFPLFHGENALLSLRYVIQNI